MATSQVPAFGNLFLSLPPELRYQIYEYTLLSPNRLCLNDTSYKQPSILHVSPDFIDIDFLEITYFSYNDFAYVMTGHHLAKDDYTDFVQYLRGLGERQLELMRGIEVISYWVCKDSDLEALTTKLERALETAGVKVERGFVRCERTAGPCKVM